MTRADVAVDVCMLGRHSSGKTTYLGALWSILRNPGSIAADRRVALRGPLPQRTAYLDAAAHALEGGESVLRTQRDTGEDVVLELIVDDAPVLLSQFDVAGESMEHMLVSRTAPGQLMNRIESCNALMLFVNPSDIALLATIRQANTLERAMGGEPPERARNVIPPVDTSVSDEQIWKHSPTAVQLIELLQVSALARSESVPRIPISVVISAWETVDPDVVRGKCSVSPVAWVDSKLPLLGQYLRANTSNFRSQILGVSAQGGDYSDEAVVEELTRRQMSERVRVSDGTIVSRDLGAPLTWLLQASA
jgi:hypothetical protein